MTTKRKQARIAGERRRAELATTKKKPRKRPAPRLHLYVDEAGEFRWALYGRNGRELCWAEGYEQRKGMHKGWAAVVDAVVSGDLVVDDQTKAKTK